MYNLLYKTIINNLMKEIIYLFMNNNKSNIFHALSKSLKNSLKITILFPFDNDKLKNNATNLQFS